MHFVKKAIQVAIAIDKAT